MKKQETRRDGEGHSMRRRHRSTERSRFQLSERLNEHTLSRVQREQTNAQIDRQTDRQTDNLRGRKTTDWFSVVRLS